MTMTTSAGDRSTGVLTRPGVIPNLVGGKDAAAAEAAPSASSIRPPAGRICQVARSSADDIRAAVAYAKAAQPAWAETTPVRRGDILRQIALLMREHRQALAGAGGARDRQVAQGRAG